MKTPKISSAWKSACDKAAEEERIQSFCCVWAGGVASKHTVGKQNSLGAAQKTANNRSLHRQLHALNFRNRFVFIMPSVPPGFPSLGLNYLFLRPTGHVSKPGWHLDPHGVAQVLLALSEGQSWKASYEFAVCSTHQCTSICSWWLPWYQACHTARACPVPFSAAQQPASLQTWPHILIQYDVI